MVLSLCASLCRMLSKSRKYSECGATASPPNQRRKPSVSAKPSAFRLLLLEISKHLGEKDVQNFKAFLEDYVRENDKGAVVVDQLQEVTTAFCLLMASAKVGFIQPDDLSNLMAFLDVSGHSALAQEIENFQENEQSECSILICFDVQRRGLHFMNAPQSSQTEIHLICLPFCPFVRLDV